MIQKQIDSLMRQYSPKKKLESMEVFQCHLTKIMKKSRFQIDETFEKRHNKIRKNST